VRDVLLDRRSRERGLLEPAAVTRVLDDHRAGRADHADTLWGLLNLELWYRTWVDGGGIQQLGTPGVSVGSAPLGERDAAAVGLAPTA
jgi:hypothetical protein